MTEPQLSRISLVVSDVDGTLLRNDKTLSARNRQAVQRLAEHGIGFTINSSRPPFGLRRLSEQLGLKLPVGAYNGGMVVAPDLAVLEQRLIRPDAALKALAIFRSFAVDAWIFTADGWSTQNRQGAYVARETRTIEVQPTIIARLEDHIEGLTKMVGVSADPQKLTSCEAAVRGMIGDDATIARSQDYYLDITPGGTNKGTIITDLIGRLGLVASGIVSIGDMENDVSMFRQSGFSIAMGNANPVVKQQADAVTLSNEEDGFADAIERLVLPRATRTFDNVRE